MCEMHGREINMVVTHVRTHAGTGERTGCRTTIRTGSGCLQCPIRMSSSIMVMMRAARHSGERFNGLQTH